MGDDGCADMHSKVYTRSEGWMYHIDVLSRWIYVGSIVSGRLLAYKEQKQLCTKHSCVILLRGKANWRERWIDPNPPFSEAKRRWIPYEAENGWYKGPWIERQVKRSENHQVNILAINASWRMNNWTRCQLPTNIMTPNMNSITRRDSISRQEILQSTI